MAKNDNYEAAIEAILFTMGDSVEVEKLAAALSLGVGETKEILSHMKTRYESEERGIHLIELEESVQLCTKAAYYDAVVRVAKQPKKHVLTEVMLETLSIIAYKQPVTRLEIEQIRGVKCDHAVNKLIEYNLVEEVGRLDAPGRPVLFGTTEEFLRCFGVESVDALPIVTQEQIEEFKAAAEEEMQLKVQV